MVHCLIHQQIDARGVSLHIVEQGNGPLVVFCHGFPATWVSWQEAMGAVSELGLRAVSFDMRGYGDSDAPVDPQAYTPFHTVGDVIAIIDHFGVDRAIIVGHDFGASVAWNAAMMRPDRIAAVFAVSVPFIQPGGPSLLDQLRGAGKTNFYMFEQMRPESVEKWAQAARSIPSSYFWTCGEAPADERWDPFDPARNLLRPVSQPPTTIRSEYFKNIIPVFERTGFQGALNYYRATDLFWPQASRAFARATIRQPSFFLTGQADGLNALRAPTEASLRETVPGLKGFAELEGVGHWPQLEASETFNHILINFLKTIDACN